MDGLSSLPLFAGVPPRELAALLEHCSVRRVAAGDRLLTAGDENRHLYVLVAGRLKVHLERADSPEGFTIEPGECIGEISIIDGRPASAHVTAEEASELLVVGDAELWTHFLCVPRINRNFMRMFAARMRSRNAAIQQALTQKLRYEQLARELAYAREIQAGLLPRDLDLGRDFEAAAEMHPARQIGGDFYDAFPLDAERYCFAVGDVAGKGVPAALLMVKAITLLRSEVLRRETLERAIDCLNRALCDENPSGTFLTLLVGILHVPSRRVSYVNAGHPPLLCGAGGVCFRPLPAVGGIPVGIEPDIRYEAGSVVLAGGDVLVLYTDGVTEAMDENGGAFGAARLQRCLEQAPTASAAELSARLRAAVRRHAGGAPQSDDLTLLVLRCLGAAGAPP